MMFPHGSLAGRWKLVAVVLTASTPVFAAAASFTPLGVSFQVTDASADGTVIVGAQTVVHPDPNLAFALNAVRWSDQTGLSSLGELAGGDVASLALGVSNDGSVVVGVSDSDFGSEAFRWTQATGMVGLGDQPGDGVFRLATDVTADGSVLVGSGKVDGSVFSPAVRWSQGDGLTDLGPPPDGTLSIVATGVSSDGSVVVGDLQEDFTDPSLDNRREAFRWTQETGIVNLGDLPGGRIYVITTGVSADGSTVVGRGTSESGDEAFRWTQEAGMIGLGDFPGGAFSSTAEAASGDGSVVVGRGWDESGSVAFVWDERHGLRSVKEVLMASGLDLAGWDLLSASWVSGDGLMIIGDAHDPDGNGMVWRAVIPEPGSAGLLCGLLFTVIGWARRRGSSNFRAVHSEQRP